MSFSTINNLMPGRETKAKVIIHTAAAAAFAMGLSFSYVPGYRFVMEEFQLTMMIQIAALFGVNLSRADARSFYESTIQVRVDPIIDGFVIRCIAGPGHTSNATIAVQVTETIGWATYNYYLEKYG